jgi:ParB family transcriptional regulator, chromosome partitioning protein
MTAKKQNLGKGLSALFGTDQTDYKELDKLHLVKSIDIKKLEANPFQPRHHFDEEAQQELIESVRDKGILQPILVRKHPSKTHHYQIIAGERRFRASQIVGLKEVPAIVKNFNDSESLEVALIENIIRAELSPIEEAEGYQRLINEFGYTQEKLGTSIHKSRSAITNSLRLLSLPENIKKYLKDGTITAGHARAILRVDDKHDLADKIVREGLSVRETEEVAKTGVNKTSAQSNAVDPGQEEIEMLLTNSLDAPVRIVAKGNKGKIQISYDSYEQLDELVNRLT